MARRVAAAREAAEQSVMEVQTQAADLKREARETAGRQDQPRYETLISEAQAEAEAVLAQARDRAEKLRSSGVARMDAVVGRAVEDVVGLKSE